MADKYLNLTTLNYYNGRIAAIYATKAEVPTKTSDLTNDSNFVTSSQVPTKTSDLTNDSNFATTSDVNTAVTIKTVKVNSTALTPDANKAVDVTVPTTVASLSDASTYANKIETVKRNGTALTITNKAVDVTVPTQVSQLSDASTYANKIEKIKVNNTEQTISSKAVNITVPTKVSDLTNDSGFQTASDVSTAISSAISGVYTYKGSVATYANLPASGNVTGDVWDVQADGTNYAWTGTTWDALGGTVDVSLFWAKADLVAITTAEIDALFA